MFSVCSLEDWYECQIYIYLWISLIAFLKFHLCSHVLFPVTFHNLRHYLDGLQVRNHPQKLWVEKSNNHRGIHIKSPKGIWLISFQIMFKFVPFQPKESNYNIVQVINTLYFLFECHKWNESHITRFVSFFCFTCFVTYLYYYLESGVQQVKKKKTVINIGLTKGVL